MKQILNGKTTEGARLTPEERRSSLINAVLRSIIKHGRDGLSVRMVCKEAGVSAGLLTHHFPGKEALITETYRQLTRQIYSQIGNTLESAAAASPEEKLRLYIDINFREPVLDQDYLKIWLVFWSLCEQTPEIASLRDKINSKVVSTLQQLIEETVAERNLPAINTRLAAIGLSALMDGLWLEWSLNQENFSPEEAAQLCQCWVDGLIEGGFSRLSARATES